MRSFAQVGNSNTLEPSPQIVHATTAKSISRQLGFSSSPLPNNPVMKKSSSHHGASLSRFLHCSGCLTATAAMLVIGALQTTISSADAQGVTSSITTNWNQTPANDTLWLNSVFSTSGAVANNQTFYFSNVAATFPFPTQNGAIETVNLPNAAITFSNSFSNPTTIFDSGTNTWVTDVPLSDAGQKIFLDGFGWQVPSPGITQNLSGNSVALTGTFSSNLAGSLQWQWAAAAYNTFSSDPNALGVLPIDENGLHAGVPSNFTNASFVDKGGSGGGSSNFTGSYSGTASVRVPVGPVPEPSSILLVTCTAALFIRRSRKRLPHEVWGKL